MPDRDNPVADLGVIAVSETQGRQILADMDLQDRDVGSFVAFDVFCVRVKLATVMQPYSDLISVGHDMIVRHDDARCANDETGTHSLPFGHSSRHLTAKEFTKTRIAAEEILEGIRHILSNLTRLLTSLDRYDTGQRLTRHVSEDRRQFVSVASCRRFRQGGPLSTCHRHGHHSETDQQGNHPVNLTSQRTHRVSPEKRTDCARGGRVSALPTGTRTNCLIARFRLCHPDRRRCSSTCPSPR